MSKPDWQRLQKEHLESVEGFVGLARAVAPDRWAVGPAEGRWSPAQVTEHVFLTYQALLRDLAGGPAMGLRMDWWRRGLLRLFLLPRILRSGRLPRAVTLRELNPGATAMDQADLLEKLRAEAVRLGAELAAHGDSVRITHPYFGALRGSDVLRFYAIHTAHHAAQLGG